MIKDKIYISGQKIHDCIFLKEVEPVMYFDKNANKKIRRRRGLFICSCGNQFETSITNIVTNKTKSCGCLIGIRNKELRQRNVTHGLSYHPLYGIWITMINRCDNPKDVNYYNYGQRGIKVCESWHKLENFINDMYPSYVKGLTLDRLNNNGNYEFSNCNWVTRKQNNNNRRSNVKIEYKGVTRNIIQWAEHLNMSSSAFTFRLKNWTIEKAIEYEKSK